MINTDDTPKKFAADAKLIVDSIFDNRLFKDNITRDDMNGYEDLIQFMLESKFNMAWKAKELFERIDHKPQTA